MKMICKFWRESRYDSHGVFSQSFIPSILSKYPVSVIRCVRADERTCGGCCIDRVFLWIKWKTIRRYRARKIL